jgi:hypothetical protein
MKRLLISVFVIFLLLFSMNVQAGQTLRASPGTAPPNSMAFGKSLDGWLEAYIIWSFWDGSGDQPADKIRNVQLLPLPVSPDTHVDIEIKVGTALVLPVAVYLGTEGEEPYPEDWFGNPNYVSGEVELDGKMIITPDENYYAEAFFDPPIFFDLLYFAQGIVGVITPLSVGVHEIILHSELLNLPGLGEDVIFDNTWTITVVPRKDKN